jgi:hypothetical protein
MYQGRTINELAAEVARQVASKKDYIAPTPKLSTQVTWLLDNVEVPPGTPEAKAEVRLHVPINSHGMDLRITNHAHRQIHTHVGIPWAYYERMMLEAPDLFKENVDHWLAQGKGARMIRTLDGKARAFVSDKYRRLDNYDLLSAVLPLIQEQGLTVKSCEVGEDRLFLKATNPAMRADVSTPKQVGDIVEAGVVISNSETGEGSVLVQPMVYRLVCTNGMTRSDNTLRKYHTGAKNKAANDVPYELLSDDTKLHSDLAFWGSVRDLTKEALTGRVWEDSVKAIREAQGQVIEASLDAVVEAVAEKHRLTGTEGDAILKHLIEGGDISKWGLTNAITRASQDATTYERASDLEEIGGRVIEMAVRDWEAMSKGRA